MPFLFEPTFWQLFFKSEEIQTIDNTYFSVTPVISNLPKLRKLFPPWFQLCGFERALAFIATKRFLIFQCLMHKQFLFLFRFSRIAASFVHLIPGSAIHRATRRIERVSALKHSTDNGFVRFKIPFATGYESLYCLFNIVSI